ncbi:hypothetical protein FOZ61_007158 [Perkinsus olseni]|uniref:Uncharacterized protein n=1 Tax=Perkinsus olseni TaxID=32597 RepID=A0A7J6LJN3_PEROL|nr:hypothetical protein FOZ61_007158 [Perkinsus olseni]KAF4659363.1 hypothetical protein FOL46_006621 [Perkinsus olseni]
MASLALFLRRLSIPVMFFILMITSGQVVLGNNSATGSLGCHHDRAVAPPCVTTRRPPPDSARYAQPTPTTTPTSYHHFMYQTSSSPSTAAAGPSRFSSVYGSSDESVSMPEEIEELVSSLQARQAMKYSSSRRIRGDEKKRPGEAADIFGIFEAIEAHQVPHAD